MRREGRRRLIGRPIGMRAVAAAAAVAVVLGLPGVAVAHATLEGTQPAQGASVARNPGRVVFAFNETVEGNFGAVRVFDTRGGRVDSGDGFHPNGTGSLIGVDLRPGLPAGTYTATYRVVSADGHIVTGGFVFSIGGRGAGGLTVAQLLGRGTTGSATTVAFSEARAVQYGAIAVAVGALVFLLGVWLPVLRVQAGGSASWRNASDAFVARLRVTLLMSALLGAISALAGVVFEAAESAGVSGWAALAPGVLREELTTRFGTIWTAAAACWLAFGVLTAGLLRPRSAHAPVLRAVPLGSTGLALCGGERRLAVGLGIALAGVVLLPALSGHGATQAPVVVMFPSIALHVTAISVWLGGLVALVVVVPAATRCLEKAERTRVLSAVVARFSGLALVAVILLLATGLVQSYIEVGRLDLLLSTDFGRAVLIKFGLLMTLVGLGAFNRRRTLPRLRQIAQDGEAPGSTGLSLRRTLRTEIALIVVALGATGALASYAPAASQYAGPYNATTTVGGRELQLTLDPAKVGSNELHVYLFDARTGVRYDGALQVTVAETLPSKGIGPLTQTAQKSGPGHYTVPGITLGLPGTWKLEITVLVDKFDAYSKTVDVPIQ
jgi:copper transport protein